MRLFREVDSALERVIVVERQPPPARGLHLVDHPDSVGGEMAPLSATQG
jgi:hypothetical protein